MTRQVKITKLCWHKRQKIKLPRSDCTRKKATWRTVMTFHMGIFILQKTFKIKSAFHSLFQSRDFATSLKLLVIPWVTGVHVESHQAIQAKRRAGPRDARMKNGQRNRKCSSWIYGQSMKTNWRALENTGWKSKRDWTIDFKDLGRKTKYRKYWAKIKERLNNRFQGSW